jgi:poly(3-hydroxybutyrate) depolymerase
MSLRFLALPALAVVAVLAVSVVAAGERRKVTIRSTTDGSDQPCYLILPDGFSPEGPPVPLLVSLHSWSGDVEQRNTPLEKLTDRQGWLYLFPHFRGPNQHPDACGSEKAQQDILDAVAWAQQHYPIDSRRIYLTGASGGGYMTMLMAGRHPDVWAAASAWVGISDLTAWHATHAHARYGAMLRQSCGGAPGDSAEVDREYRDRSPLTHLAGARDVPLDLCAGVHDGHRGSVPIRHTLEAFNVIARARGAAPVSEDEIQQLSRVEGRLDQPQPGDEGEDAAFGRKYYLRRWAGPVRVTIFEGGHEDIAAATVAWLQTHGRQGKE